jgi:hypothetical protein
MFISLSYTALNLYCYFKYKTTFHLIAAALCFMSIFIRI